MVIYCRSAEAHKVRLTILSKREPFRSPRDLTPVSRRDTVLSFLEKTAKPPDPDRSLTRTRPTPATQARDVSE